jgi:hypothetical protein
MRTIVTGVLVLAVTVLLLAGTASGGDKPWFDMEKCELCKVFMEEPILMASMNWEEFEVYNGTVSVTTVKKEYLPAYRTAHKKMMKNIDRLEQGDTLYLCGMCTEIGRLMELGAVYEYFETEQGSVSLFTAAGPEVIAAIKAMSVKGKEEWEKMEAMNKKDDHGHEGHDHD